jgi:SOS-response transcriptional repressor LexA
LLGKEKQRELKRDTAWFDGAHEEPVRSRPRAGLRLVWCEREEAGAVPVYDLRIAAGAFSEGQIPEASGYGRVEGGAVRRGGFVAKVVGDSMDKVAPDGAWCLRQHLGAAGVAGPMPGENIVVRRSENGDPGMGRFTFKRLVEDERGRSLVPLSTNPNHRAIPLREGDEVEAVARFVGVVHPEEESP